MEIGVKFEELRRTAGRAMRRMARAPEVTPYDEIDSRSVCTAIGAVLSRVTYEKHQDARLNRFSAMDVMHELGHEDAVDDPKLINDYQRIKGKINLIFGQLIKNGVLQDIVLDKPDADNETIKYQLKKEENGSIEEADTKRKQIAEGSPVLEVA